MTMHYEIRGSASSEMERAEDAPFELDLESDEELNPLCDLSDDGTCESCQ